MYIHKSFSFRRRKNGTLVDGIDISGNIKNKPPKANITIHNCKTKKLTTKDILSYFNKTQRKGRGKRRQTLKKRLSSLHKKLSRRKRKKRK